MYNDNNLIQRYNAAQYENQYDAKSIVQLKFWNSCIAQFLLSVWKMYLNYTYRE